MPKLTLLCGLPGSGKTTFAKQHLASYGTYVSRDDIRFSLLRDDEDYFTHETTVWSKYISSLVFSLKQGRDVIADSTNLTAKARKRLINNIDLFVKEPYSIEICAFNVPLDIVLSRNATRQGRALVPADTIRKMAKTYVFPSYKEDSRITTIFEIDEDGKAWVI